MSVGEYLQSRAFGNFSDSIQTDPLSDVDGDYFVIEDARDVEDQLVS
jgi:hypothetical protein